MNEGDFPEVKTGNGVDRDLAATANDRIKKAVVEIHGLKEAVASLEKTIVELDTKSQRLQQRIFWFTVVASIFAATQLLQAIDILISWFT